MNKMLGRSLLRTVLQRSCALQSAGHLSGAADATAWSCIHSPRFASGNSAEDVRCAQPANVRSSHGSKSGEHCLRNHGAICVLRNDSHAACRTIATKSSMRCVTALAVAASNPLPGFGLAPGTGTVHGMCHASWPQSDRICVRPPGARKLAARVSAQKSQSQDFSTRAQVRPAGRAPHEHPRPPGCHAVTLCCLLPPNLSAAFPQSPVFVGKTGSQLTLNNRSGWIPRGNRILEGFVFLAGRCVRLRISSTNPKTLKPQQPLSREL